MSAALKEALEAMEALSVYDQLEAGGVTSMTDFASLTDDKIEALPIKLVPKRKLKKLLEEVKTRADLEDQAKRDEFEKRRQEALERVLSYREAAADGLDVPVSFDPEKDTWMNNHAHSGNEAKVRAYLQAGSSPNVQNTGGKSAMHHAAGMNRANIL
eukprot:CAMPEP_0181333346 /NCGR_PEP_ID=MMETSP1101-20121128/25624_1 /TAXON_ID=46948 /ORGANISM="Rhodomonas abbreviata, Strain Caron Lab Isolate" /LENGTH=156 /DNA_ID=CAMNT_0023443143 /DNA_START=24 /DNA_END=490 /DNA_ORIENTATION=-